MSASEIKPFILTGEHSYHRRSFAHNYHWPFIYHIILKKARSCEEFGTIEGDARIAPGNAGAAKIRESALGQTIAKALLHLPYKHSIIKLHQFCVMPDHVHVLLQVLRKSEQHLDFYIRSLKDSVARNYSGITGKAVSRIDIFEAGYCDKPLYDTRSLDGLYRYIRENPHRLAMRQQFPEFFHRTRKLLIGDEEYEAYGNLFLFRNPDKEAVKISKKDSIAEIEEKTEHWLNACAEGTILVSPFISKSEKEIREKAERAGGNIILITHEAFSERFKPLAHDFEQCSQGRLLIISLGQKAKQRLTRGLCVKMNALAKTLCGDKPAPCDNPAPATKP